MKTKRWIEGRETTAWALEYADSQNNPVTRPTVISSILEFNLGLKISGRWKVDVYRWKEHISKGTDFSGVGDD